MELERPNAAFMHEDEMGQMREGSATPPTPSSIPGIYKNSAAAAMGSTSQLVGGGEFLVLGQKDVVKCGLTFSADYGEGLPNQRRKASVRGEDST